MFDTTGTPGVDRPPVMLAYGGGTNSKALLLELYERGLRPDVILFADTGGELPETYADVRATSDWIAARGFPPIVWVSNAGLDASLEANCLRLNMLPSIAYGHKSCSEKWKQRPQHRYAKAWEPARLWWGLDGRNRRTAAGYYGAGGPLPFARRNVVKLIGYDWSEGHRGDITTDDFYDYLYPLKAWHHERRHNVETIARHGLPQPGKSACFFCPSSKKPELVQLAVRHPELRDRAVAMEANAAGNLKTVKGLGRRFSWTEFFATLEGPANPGKDSPCMCVGAVDEGSVIDSDDE